MKLFPIKPLILFSALCLNLACYSQDIQSTNPLLNYLFPKYGIEESESILMKMKAYENKNDVFVFDRKDYEIKMSALDHKILYATSEEQKQLLLSRKSKIVCFQEIEDTILKLKL